MSDIRARVDRAFSDAVEAQVQEQREMRQLVARVEETLAAVSDGLVDLGRRIETDGRSDDATAVINDHLDTALAALGDRLRADVEALLDAVAVRAEQMLAAQNLERIDELQARFESLELALLHQVGELKADAAETRSALDRLTEEVAGFAASTPQVPSQPPPLTGTQRWVVSSDTAGHVCSDCGFAARTPPGLAAHRATCARRQRR